MARRLEYKITSCADGKKIKDFLKHEVGISHRMLCILKRTPQGITVNDAHARTVDCLHAGDLLVLTMPDDEATSVSTPTEIPLDIVYEDADILVLNKPAGLAMHETHNHQGDALSNAVAYYLGSRGETGVFRAVGRLDKGTSGLVVCAKNKYAAFRLAGKVEKTYYAVAGGVFTGCGIVDAPIVRPDPNKTLRAVGTGGERAVTHWEALKNDGKCTLLRIHLETGRTHQIRVHFAHLGAPLAGDEMYGSSDLRLTHQALHCGECTFYHPVTEERITCEATLPDDMAALLGDME